jgi:hypothetical protein
MSIPKRNIDKLLMRFRTIDFLKFFIFSKISIKFDLIESMFWGWFLHFFHKHMLILPCVHYKMALFSIYLISYGWKGCLFIEDLRCWRLFMLYSFWYFIIAESHGPIEIILINITFGQKMPKLSYISRH